MKRLVSLVLIGVAVTAGFNAGVTASDFMATTTTNATCTVYFIPQSGCTDAVVEKSNKAQPSALVQA